MPFREDTEFTTYLALPEDFDLNPDAEPVDGNVLASAFRLENPLVSLFNSFQPHREAMIDPDYRPFDDIQGTEFEPYWERFTEVRNSDHAEQIKAKISREIEDRKVLQASGGWGVLAQIGAALLSPTSLAPGGAIIKSAKGVSIARTGLAVSGSAALATSLDELSLQSSQETRTWEESAVAIGGSVILGGLLGASVGKLASHEYTALVTKTEDTLVATYELDRALRSVGAATTAKDLTLRNENLFQTIRKLPVVGRPLVGSDPLLRSMLHDFTEVRSASARLAEPVLEYEVNLTGQTALGGAVPVETRVKSRRQNELGGLHADFSRSYAEYSKDGPVGHIGTITAPITGKWAHLLGFERKMSAREFAGEISKAVRRGDKHPIPQVQSMAEKLRRNLFDKVGREAEELGLLPEGITLANSGTYLPRIYNVEKINMHYGDGSADDILPVLEREFLRKSKEAQARIDKLEVDVTNIGEAAQKAIDKDRVFAGQTNAEIKTAVAETVQSIKGLKPGQSAWRVALADPTRARVLDVSDELLEPWLEPDIRVVMTRHFDSMVPDMEIIREFGDLEMSDVIKRINDEEARRLGAAKGTKAHKRIVKDAKGAREDLEAMRDRIRGVYKLPDNPRNAWVVGGRVARTFSFTGLLGGFMLSAAPDLGNVLGRSGVEAAFGSLTAFTDPRRMGIAMKDAADLGAAAEWFLNGRAMEIANLTDPFGSMTKSERLIGDTGRLFSYVSGVIPWNAGWKTVGGAFVSSRMAKASEAVRAGKATPKQLRILAANGIEPWMAERIALQIERHGDTDGKLWLPRGALWDDAEAFQAFRHAMTREFDLMVPTPGQDKPLAFSSELGKFLFQFKSFAFSAHQRILLAGIQKADADTLATVVPMLALGVLISNIKADQYGNDRKQGAALWEDAIDRSGLAGWLFEIHSPANALFGGALSLSGEEISRYRAKSTFEGLTGPSFGIGVGLAEGISAASKQAAGTGKLTSRDIDQMSRALPGNNLWYLLPLFQQIEDVIAAEFGSGG